MSKAAQTKPETDHEFKTRMAKEGKAIYVPGKTDAEAKAAHLEKLAAVSKPVSLSIELTEAQCAQLDLALPDIAELITDASRVFTFLASGFVMGHVDPKEDAVVSIMRLSARALNGAEERELPVIDLMDMKLRQAHHAATKGAAS